MSKDKWSVGGVFLPPGMKVWLVFNAAGTQPLGYVRAYDKRYAAAVAKAHGGREISVKPKAFGELAASLKELQLPKPRR